MKMIGCIQLVANKRKFLSKSFYYFMRQEKVVTFPLKSDLELIDPNQSTFFYMGSLLRKGFDVGLTIEKRMAPSELMFSLYGSGRDY